MNGMNGLTRVRRRARAARTLTDFDSSVNMVRALGRFLHGKDHRGMSVGPGSRRLADAMSALPEPLRRRLFRHMGVIQGIPPRQVDRISTDDIADWVTQQYPPGPYQSVIVGAPSGAAVHLAAALRAPFLPQTKLVSVRDPESDPDDPVAAMRAVAPMAARVAENNPDVAVYHMHDPAQDRPMLERMAYLRLKRLRLGAIYERFITDRLAPGGTIIVLECHSDWRSTAVAGRTYFQFGCAGGVPEEEYFDSGERIAAYLAQEGSRYRSWQPPEPDARRPEAEWGFDPAIRPDLERVADEHGFRLRRLLTGEPQQLSAFVANLHRWWYRRRGMRADRLLAESYVQWDPLWMLRLGAVPFWLQFPMRPSYQTLRDYLAGLTSYDEPYEEILVNLFSHGLHSPGLVPLEQWRELAESMARSRGDIIGVHEHAFPADPGSSMRYQPAYAALPQRHPLPPPLPVDNIDRFLAKAGDEYSVRWK